jgi:hypothetical protein
VAVLKLISAVAGGLAGGLAAADRAVSSASDRSRQPAVPEPSRDSDAPRRLRAAFPSQRASAALLDPYVARAEQLARTSFL